MKPKKLQIAYDAIRFTGGDVSAAKATVAKAFQIRISARTWAKAFDAWVAVQPAPVLN